MNRRRVVLLFVGMIPRVEEPNFELEEIQKVLTQNDKVFSDCLDVINKDIMSPKEYGLKKLRTKKYKGC